MEANQHVRRATWRRHRRPLRRTSVALPLLLALLYLSTLALAATHHHEPSARDACSACSAAHGAALAAPLAPLGPAPAGRVPVAVLPQHQTVTTVALRVRGPPIPNGAA